MAFGPLASSGCQCILYYFRDSPICFEKDINIQILTSSSEDNSKVNFYFYKKRQSKQYKTHVKDIIE